MYGLITNIQKFSVHDGPGIRTTVFLKGCPMQCIWCQNPETITSNIEIIYNSIHCVDCKKCIDVCQRGCFTWKEEIKYSSENCNYCGACIKNCSTGALKWSVYKTTSEEILREVIKDKDYYDVSGGGITLSGGEPLQQPDFCCEIASKSKACDIKVALDTSGYAPFEIFERIMPFIDVFLYDIKFIDNNLHEEYTGKPNKIILDNFERLCKMDKDIIVRIPLISGMTDKRDNISQIEDFVSKCKKGIEIEKIPFNVLMIEKYRMLGKPYPEKVIL